MYDELIRSLRICAEGEHCDKCAKWEAKQNGGLNVCQTELCKDAADAVEELQADKAALNETVTNLQEQIKDLRSIWTNWKWSEKSTEEG